MLLKIFLGYLLITGGVFLFQRQLLYHPTVLSIDTVMEAWRIDGKIQGFRRTVSEPKGVWLVCHGNGGQAAKRDYLLDEVAGDTVVHVLEYPGFGGRPGKPSLKLFNAAAEDAYRMLRAEFPGVPMGVIGESIGSGPASHLGTLTPAPDKIVLLVPYDKLSRVVAHHTRILPGGLILRDRWDNIRSLQNFSGPVEIYAAEDDSVIPPQRARALADAFPGVHFELMPGGHDTWELDGRFELPELAGLAAEPSATVNGAVPDHDD